MTARWSLSLTLLIAACGVTKPVAPTPTPVSIQAYLSEHSHSTLRVTDSSGRKRWIYDARLRGDTLRGLRNANVRWDSLAVPLEGVSEVAARRFSPTRTLGLLGGLAAIVGFVAIATKPETVY